jgi:hypothetical protein
MQLNEPQPDPTPKASKRSTKAEVARRIQEILKLRLGGAEFLDLREFADAPAQGWNVSNTQIRRYIAAADALCEKLFDAKAGHLLARHLLQRRQPYAHALGAGDFGTALRVLQDEAKLESIYDLDLLKRVESLETLLSGRPNNRSTQHVSEKSHRTPGSESAAAPSAAPDSSAAPATR